MIIEGDYFISEETQKISVSENQFMKTVFLF